MARPIKRRLVQVLESKRLLDEGFLRVDKSKISYQLPSGRLSDQVRINVDRGDAVAAILHEVPVNTLHFVRQFRFSTYVERNEPAPENGWLLEIIAGVVEANERREEAIVREIREETGFQTFTACEPIGAFYLTPGASSERLFLFYVAVNGDGRLAGDAADEDPELRGVDDERIESVSMSPAEFLDEVAAMRIRDAKTIVAAEYIRRHAGVFGLA